MSVRIVTDSTADISPELAAQHQITIVPLVVIFGDEVLQDGIDITSERFFKRLVREPQLPTTSQPSVGAFQEVYEALKADGATEILSIHLSGKLSKTIESARQAAAEIEGVRIVHIDSHLASLALGMGVIHAAEDAAAALPFETIRARVEAQFERTQIFFMVDTLEYLRRGGRIGRGQELLGSLLQFKPILSIRDGEVVPVGRVRTKQKAMEELLRLAGELRPWSEAVDVHATTPDSMEYLVERLHGMVPEVPITLGRITPVVGVHAGPGLLGIAIVSSPSVTEA